jgi:hypothetical protein
MSLSETKDAIKELKTVEKYAILKHHRQPLE